MTPMNRMGTIARHHTDRSVEFSLVVAALLPGCLAVELVKRSPPSEAATSRGVMAGALDRARGSAALAFSRPG